jgi:hypothetical protein
MIVTENHYHGETAKWRRMNSKRIPTRETPFVDTGEDELLDLLDSRRRFEVPFGTTRPFPAGLRLRNDLQTSRRSSGRYQRTTVVERAERLGIQSRCSERDSTQAIS